MCVASAASAAPAGEGGATPTIQAAPELELELLYALNDVRARRGLRRLRLSRELSASAQAHSRSMAQRGFFSHASADGSSFAVRIGRFYRRPRDWRVYFVGENLLRGTPDMGAREMVGYWLASPGHRQNVYGNWRDVGYGAVRVIGGPDSDDGEELVIVTADFGLRG